MKLVGNAPVWKELLSSMPPVAILGGPDGIGKFTGASILAGKLSGGNALILRSMYASDASKLRRWLSVLGPRRIAVVDSDKSSPQAWNSLLRPFEEVPPGAHVWVVGSHIPDAIFTRSEFFEFSPLTPEQVLGVVKSQGLIEEGAVEVNLSSVTSIEDALRLRDSMGKASSVKAWIEAVENGSREGILNAAAGWTEAATELLRDEIESRYVGDTSTVSGTLSLDNNQVLTVLSLLARKGPPVAVAIGAGLALTDST